MQIQNQARHSGSSAMSGPMDEQTALAAVILWNSGHFDTYDIGKLLSAPEDAVYRTLRAARQIGKGGES